MEHKRLGTGGFASLYNDDQRNGLLRYSAPIDLDIFNAGIRASKILSRPAGPSILRGQFELGVELMPYWQAHYPAQTLLYHSGNAALGLAPLPSQNRFGISTTPFLCRWNFTTSSRIVPWAQLGGGLLWTNHKFPQYPYRLADTSVINFTPQSGIGANIFVRPRQSLFFAVNAVHISNASLGDSNPGVNVTTQFSVGYSFWK
jgi:lipid A 3-O-deacylase